MPVTDEVYGIKFPVLNPLRTLPAGPPCEQDLAEQTSSDYSGPFMPAILRNMYWEYLGPIGEAEGG